MTKTLILYYSHYGHIAAMAEAVADGVRAAGGEAHIRRVADGATDHGHPLLTDPKELAQYDAIIVGTPTRFGRMAGAMAAFWDTAGGIWAQGLLNGKVGAAFTSSATQHGGQETTLFSIITNLMHFGLTIVGLDYGYAGQMGVDEVRGGAPYGATTIAHSDGSRKPSDADLGGARYLGEKVARIAAKLAA